MVNEIELYVCDNCELVLLGDGDNHVCMECEQPMSIAKFVRQPTQLAPDVCPECGGWGGVAREMNLKIGCGACASNAGKA